MPPTTVIQTATRASSRKRRLKPWLLGLKLVLGAAILALIAVQIDAGRLVKLLAGADVFDIILSIVVLSLGIVANAHRWMIVTRQIGQPLGFRTCLVGFFESMFFNQILPTSIGGDAARVFRAVDAGVVYGWAIVGVLVDRALGLCILAACLLAARFADMSAVAQAPALQMLCATSGVILLGAAAAAAGGALIGADRVPVWAAAVLALVEGFYATLASRAVPALLLDLGLSTASTVISFVFCAHALGVSVGWLDATIVVQGVVLASILPASIGGWGLREGASIVLLAPAGVGADEATAISLLFGLSITAVGLVGAAVWLTAGYNRRVRPLHHGSAIS